MSSTPEQAAAECDPRFPSGNWVGFFLDRRIPGRHMMELRLSFVAGKVSGESRDRVGHSNWSGRYQTSDGTCLMSKTYPGSHDVVYRGFAEGKGIWGTWSINVDGSTATGGFHIWPEGMTDPTRPELAESADVPVEELVTTPLELSPARG